MQERTQTFVCCCYLDFGKNAVKTYQMLAIFKTKSFWYERRCLFPHFGIGWGAFFRICGIINWFCFIIWSRSSHNYVTITLLIQERLYLSKLIDIRFLVTGVYVALLAIYNFNFVFIFIVRFKIYFTHWHFNYPTNVACSVVNH